MRRDIVAWYDSLSQRDLENGAVRDEIRQALRVVDLIQAPIEELIGIINQFKRWRCNACVERINETIQ